MTITISEHEHKHSGITFADVEVDNFKIVTNGKQGEQFVFEGKQLLAIARQKWGADCYVQLSSATPLVEFVFPKDNDPANLDSDQKIVVRRILISAQNLFLVDIEVPRDFQEPIDTMADYLR